MSRSAVALLAAVALTATALHAQTPDPPRAFLLFIDDLHLDFRQTPRTRALMQRLLRDVARDGDVWAVVTTGTSSVNVAPTTDVAAMNLAVSRVTGNGLKPAELMQVTPRSGAMLEQQHRATASVAVAIRAIETIAAAAPRARLTVFHLSDGYDTRVVPAMPEVARAATLARAYLVAVLVPDLVPGRDVPADVPPDAWAAYVEATHQSLRTLAEQTGGIAVFSREELDAEFTRLAQP
jgi:hypothetical protein